MQFPESWLREFCNPPLSTQALADLLTMAGMEVESVRPVAPAFQGVVIAEIVSAEPHPQADRLRVCQVDVGDRADGLLQIVCGAPNARVGLRAPLAMVGAVLPPGADGKAMSIGVGKLRGVDSHGMLCSARELGIASDHSGLLELTPDAPAGGDLREWMKLDDAVFTLKLTPNLGHALSVYGIAREVSALTGSPLCTPAIPAVAPGHDQQLAVEVQAPVLCGRFSGRIVRGVDTQARTPAWMVDRLARCGQRSVTALVDISNYVMFEFGQPTHIFDLDKIHAGLVVRWGRPGERLELLNGNTIEVDADVGVIADAKAVESLAGIMGGQATAVSDSTRNVFVEAAFWWPDAVSGRSRRYNFSTDAGHRFERGVDPSATVTCIEHITRLIQQICGGQAGPMQDQVCNLPAATPVGLRVDRAAKVIGMALSQDQCADVFRRLGFVFTEAEGLLTVVPPSWRFDLRIEEDLIEEVIRVIGYDKLPATPPLAPVSARVRTEARRSAHAVRHALAALDYQETINFSFVEERWERELAGNARPIAVLNPIASPLSVMRSSLIGSLVQVLRSNLAHRIGRVRVFEIGRVFRHDATVPDGALTVAGVAQPMRLAGLAFGPSEPVQWGSVERPVDFFDLKADLERLFAPRSPAFVADVHPAMHPGRCARVELEGHAIGHVGELHPKWRQSYELPQAPVLFELDLQAVLGRLVPMFRALHKLQPVWRDLALVLREEVAHDALVDCLCADSSGVVASATLFDIYKPAAGAPGWQDGERSLAFRLELQARELTLTEAQIQGAVDAALSRVQSAFGARLRA